MNDNARLRVDLQNAASKARDAAILSDAPRLKAELARLAAAARLAALEDEIKKAKSATSGRRPAR